MCGMCAVRCSIEVHVRDGKPVWIQGNPNDAEMGTSLCPKGAAGIAFEQDDERPQRPMIRTGPRGSGQWREVSWDEALDYITERLIKIRNEHGGRAIALSDRSGPFIDLTKSFLKALGSPNYFDHDCSCGGNAHNATRSLFGVSERCGSSWRRAIPGPNAPTLTAGRPSPPVRQTASGAFGLGADMTLTWPSSTRFWPTNSMIRHLSNVG